MKKVVTLLLAVCLLCCLPFAVSAATINESSDPKTVNADIATVVNPTYTVTIPADITVEFNATSTNFGKIQVDAAQIHPDKCIKVTLTTDGTLKNSIDEEKVIPYKVMAGEQVFTAATYLEKDQETALTIAIAQDDWNKAYAGEYADTVTFAVAYADKVA